MKPPLPRGVVVVQHQLVKTNNSVILCSANSQEASMVRKRALFGWPALIGLVITLTTAILEFGLTALLADLKEFPILGPFYLIAAWIACSAMVFIGLVAPFAEIILTKTYVVSLAKSVIIGLGVGIFWSYATSRGHLSGDSPLSKFSWIGAAVVIMIASQVLLNFVFCPRRK